MCVTFSRYAGLRKHSKNKKEGSKEGSKNYPRKKAISGRTRPLTET
jgi:hypothetical protein